MFKKYIYISIAIKLHIFAHLEPMTQQKIFGLLLQIWDFTVLSFYVSYKLFQMRITNVTFTDEE